MITKSQNNLRWKGTPKVSQSYPLLRAILLTSGCSGQHTVIHVLWSTCHSHQGSTLYERPLLSKGTIYHYLVTLYCFPWKVQEHFLMLKLQNSTRLSRIARHTETWLQQQFRLDCEKDYWEQSRSWCLWSPMPFQCFTYHSCTAVWLRCKSYASPMLWLTAHPVYAYKCISFPEGSLWKYDNPNTAIRIQCCL